MKNDVNIELRSEKVRNIIGQIPKRIIRMGISVIFFIFSILIGFAYLIKFDYLVQGLSVLHQKNDTIFYSVQVPLYEAKRVKPNQKILIGTSKFNNLLIDNIETNVQQIDTNNYITNSENYRVIKGFLLKPEIVLKEEIEVSATIYTDKTNVINLVLNKVKN